MVNSYQASKKINGDTYPSFGGEEFVEVFIKGHDRVVRNSVKKLVQGFLSSFQEVLVKSIKVLAERELLRQGL